MIQRLPLLSLSLALYAMLYAIDSKAAEPWYLAQTTQLRLLSSDTWRITAGDAFLALSLLLLLIEVTRAAGGSRDSLVNHALAVFVFIGAFTLFLLQPGYGNSVFFGLVLMSLLDFVAGFIIGVLAARRDVAITPAHAEPH